MKSFKNKTLSLLTYLPFRSFQSACKNVERSFFQNWVKTQSLILQPNLFWSKKGFNQQSNLDDFPITDYDFYHSAMLKGMNTGKSPFTNEEVLLTMMTSGTSGSMKPFLMTKSFKKQYQIVAAPFIHCMTKLIDYGKGKLIYLISLDSSGFEKAKTPTGTIGNFTYKKIPFFLKKLYALPDHILSSPEKFQQEAPLYALATDVVAIYSVTPPIAINFLKNVLDSDLKNKINTVLTNSNKFKLSQTRRTHLESLIKLPTITAIDIWPDLQMLSCWTSSICALSIGELQEMTAMTPVADGIYSATEGWVCVQTDFDREGSIYHPDGAILEFIELGLETNKENLIPPWKLEVGKQYEVFFTNHMGLIRYRIGDILECKDFYFQSPVLQFVSKTSSSLSLGIMRVSENDLISATKSLIPSRCRYFFSASGSGQGLGLYIYEDDIKTISNIENLVALVDQNIRSISKDYKKEQDNGTLEPLQMITTQSDKYFLKDQTGQIKPTILVQSYQP